MWPFKDIKDWERKDFDPPLDADKQIRRIKAEKESKQDLQKPLQQFLCDVHEESDRPPCEKSNNKQLTYAEDRILDALDKLSCENKRIVALQTVTAYESSKSTNIMVFLTLVITVLTIALVVDVSFKYTSKGLAEGNSLVRPNELSNTTNYYISCPCEKQKQ